MKVLIIVERNAYDLQIAVPVQIHELGTEVSFLGGIDQVTRPGVATINILPDLDLIAIQTLSSSLCLCNFLRNYRPSA